MISHDMGTMRLFVGDVVIWDPRPDLGLCLVAIVRNDGVAPDDLRDWLPELRSNAPAFARATVRNTRGRVLTWSKDRAIALLDD